MGPALTQLCLTIDEIQRDFPGSLRVIENPQKDVTEIDEEDKNKQIVSLFHKGKLESALQIYKAMIEAIVDKGEREDPFIADKIKRQVSNDPNAIAVVVRLDPEDRGVAVCLKQSGFDIHKIWPDENGPYLFPPRVAITNKIRHQRRQGGKLDELDWYRSMIAEVVYAVLQALHPDKLHQMDYKLKKWTLLLGNQFQSFEEIARFEHDIRQKGLQVAITERLGLRQ